MYICVLDKTESVIVNKNILFNFNNISILAEFQMTHNHGSRCLHVSLAHVHMENGSLYKKKKKKNPAVSEIVFCSTEFC